MMTIRVFINHDNRKGSYIEEIPLDTPMLLYAKTFLPGMSFEILSVEY